MMRSAALCALVAALGLFGCGGDDGGSGGDGGAGGGAGGMGGGMGGMGGGMGGAGGGMGGDGGAGGMEAPGLLVAEPTMIAFPPTGVGATSSVDLVLRNDGEGPLMVTAFDGLAEPFGTSRTPPVSIPSGGMRTLQMDFRPDGEGNIDQQVTFVTDNPDQDPVVVMLSGEGVEATAELVADTLDLGVLAPGEAAGNSIQLLNTSESVVLKINSVAGIEAPFEQLAQLPFDVLPGNTGDLQISFVSEEGGEFEQTATVVTNAGNFEVTLRARVVDAGDLTVTEVSPAWGANDAPVQVTITGGPFEVAPTGIMVGDQALENIELIDASRVTATVPAGGAVTGTVEDVLDVRVEIGASFGLLADGFVRTGPVAMGSMLDAAALANPVGPAGNPWTLAIDAVPAEATLNVEPGAVILANDGAALTVNGALQANGAEGRIVFSTTSGMPGGFGGLSFPDGGEASSLTNVSLEYADEAAIVLNRGNVTLDGLVIFAGTGDGILVGPGGVLVLVGARIHDMANAGINLTSPEAILVRLGTLDVRRAEVPVSAWVGHFGGRPQGAGSVFMDNRNPGAIGLVGPTAGDLVLSNQPDGITYRLSGPLSIARGSSLSLAAAAPLVLDAPINVEGTLNLPQGLRLMAESEGLIRVLGGGTLSAQGGNGAEVIISGRAADAMERASDWRGILVEEGATLNLRFVILQDGGAGEGENTAALTLNGALDDVVGLKVYDSVGAAVRTAGTSLRAVEMRGNAEGVVVTGGQGLLAGVTEDEPPALRFDPPALCADWMFNGFQTPGGMPASNNCD